MSHWWDEGNNYYGIHDSKGQNQMNVDVYDALHNHGQMAKQYTYCTNVYEPGDETATKVVRPRERLSPLNQWP